jgi:hypothetical protein
MARMTCVSISHLCKPCVLISCRLVANFRMTAPTPELSIQGTNLRFADHSSSAYRIQLVTQLWGCGLPVCCQSTAAVFRAVCLHVTMRTDVTRFCRTGQRPVPAYSGFLVWNRNHVRELLFFLKCIYASASLTLPSHAFSCVGVGLHATTACHGPTPRAPGHRRSSLIAKSRSSTFLWHEHLRIWQIGSGPPSLGQLCGESI